jgi:SMI1/KNR4 family protein SUKH-1/HEAT repeat protein
VLGCRPSPKAAQHGVPAGCDSGPSRVAWIVATVWSVGAEWDVETIRPVVHAWDEAVRGDVPSFARLMPEAERRGSVLRRGASEEQIAAEEARLGVELPASYRSFLRITNGAWAGALGADYYTRTTRPAPAGLVPIERVVPLAAGDPIFFDVWVDSDEMKTLANRQELVRPRTWVDVYDFEPARRALMITERVSNAVLALVPFPGEWQIWALDHSGVSACASFKDWLALATERARTRLASRDAEAALEQIRSGWTRPVGLLAKWGDPRALAVACAVLLDPDLPEAERTVAIEPLAALGDPLAITPLRQALATLTQPLARLAAVEALDVCGDPEAVDMLEQIARTEPDETARRLARRHLAVRDDLRRPWT